MEDNITGERNDEAIAANPAAAAEAVPHDDNVAEDPRYQRIVDYLNTALAIQDPLASNVAAVNSDLMLMGYRLKQAIEAAMDMTPAALDEFEKLMPAIDSYLRLSRQVERLAKFNKQLTATASITLPAELVTEQATRDGESEETQS